MKLKLLALMLLLVGLIDFGMAQPYAESQKAITEAEVIAAQKMWGDAIVEIGKAYSEKKDYKALAEKYVEMLYGYDKGIVLFKPTKASVNQFRLTQSEAVSYFAGGIVKEDLGFALQPWSSVRFENSGITRDKDSALAMGNYCFTDAGTGKEVKVEYTFGYFKDAEGNLQINLHHSSFPYHPQH